MRTLLLLLLAALPARSGDIVRLSIDKDMPLGDFVLDMADRCGWTVLCDTSVDLRQEMGAPFAHGIPVERLGETVRAILAFYEVRLVDVGGNVRVAMPARSPGFYKRCVLSSRRGFAVLGLRGTTLELDVTVAYPAGATRLDVTPRTRDRLLLGLRYGLHPRGREHAARLLGAIGPRFRSTADALARALDDEDAAVRLAAVRALAGCGDAATHVLPRLRALTRAEDRTLRHAAREACRRLAPADQR